MDWDVWSLYTEKKLTVIVSTENLVDWHLLCQGPSTGFLYFPQKKEHQKLPNKVKLMFTPVTFDPTFHLVIFYMDRLKILHGVGRAGWGTRGGRP